LPLVLRELGAYLSFFRRADAASAYRAIAQLAIKSRLAIIPPLPSSHPVFDKVSGQLGLLSASLAHDVSRIYNIVTNIRLIITNLSSERFAQAHDAAQKGIIEFIASTIDTEVPNANTLVTALERESRRWPWVPIVVTGISVVVIGLIWYFGFFADLPARVLCDD
jgi:hypothetical protein